METKHVNGVVNDFLTIAQKHGLQSNVVVHGSVGYGAELVPFWSDIDASVIISRATAKALRSIENMRSEYMSKHSDIPLSLTVIEESDTVSNNYFHHHGVKPMAYNFELAKQSETVIPFRYNQHVLRASSVYRYYEIMFTFRRDIITNPKFSANVVARGYHRLSRLLRTQIEIMHPEIVLVLRATRNSLLRLTTNKTS